MVGAQGDRDGAAGDSVGGEICVSKYSNKSWDGYLRYVGTPTSQPPTQAPTTAPTNPPTTAPATEAQPTTAAPTTAPTTEAPPTTAAPTTAAETRPQTNVPIIGHDSYTVRI